MFPHPGFNTECLRIIDEDYTREREKAFYSLHLTSFHDPSSLDVSDGQQVNLVTKEKREQKKYNK